MIRLPDLPTTFYTLNDPKYQSTHHQQDSHPIPRDPFSVIPPPLLERSWTAIIEILFQNNKAIMPEMEVVDLSFLQLELAAFHCFWV